MNRDDQFLFHTFKFQIMRIATLPRICNLIFTMCLNWKTSTRKNALLRKYNSNKLGNVTKKNQDHRNREQSGS